MAMHVDVRFNPKQPNHYEVEGSWESEMARDEGPSLRVLVPKVPGMTAAEAVEWYMLVSENMVASWLWSEDCCGRNGALHGQFVQAQPEGKSYKEVNYSLAHRFDFPTSFQKSYENR